MTLAATIFAVALIACAICSVEWAAARTNSQHRLFKTLTPVTAVLALVAGIAAGASGEVATLGWSAGGSIVIFVGYGIYRAVTRKA